MAILKHIASKNKIYSAAEQYLLFEHDAKTGKPLLDNAGRMVPREGIITDSINCDFNSFAAECMETNHLYHKNRSRSDIKSHDYILSFDPRDNITGEEAMEIAKKFAGEFLEGHQTIIVVHPDGHNGSGNIHAHIVANSVRKHQAVKQKWHEKACEYKQGCKHKCTNAMLRAGKQWVMAECRSRNLNQVDLFSSKVREDYWVKKRGLEKDSEFMSDKEKLRNMIEIAIDSTDSLEDFSDVLDNQFGVTTRITNKTISFKLENSKQAVRGNRLGDDYTKDALIYRIDERKKAKSILEAERKAEAARLVAQLDKKTKSEQKQHDPWKELSDKMAEVSKLLDASKRKEEVVLSRFETLLDDEISSKEADITPSVDIQSEANLPQEEYQEPIESQKSAEEQKPMKTVGKESVVVDDREAVQDSTETVHYDSYVTDDYVSAAISVEADADIELQEIRKPKEWKEEFSDYLKSHPGIVIDEAVEGFGAYYDKLWDDYNSRSNKTIDREIKVKSR